MRSFANDAGDRWDATVGRESWGTFVVVFTPAAGGPPLKAVLSAETALHADRELDELSESELRTRLREAVPWANDG